MPRNEVRWERMFPDELEAAFENRPIVYLPYGLCEPHGPINAVGMDALRAHSTSVLAAERHGGIVAPANYWHIHEQGGYGTWAHSRVGDARPWLTALPSWMFLKNLCYHIRAVDALGFKGALLFSGHSGPHRLDVPRVLDVMREHVSARLFSVIGTAEPQSRFPDGKGMGGHAGRGETTLLWAVDPDCVDLSRMPTDDSGAPHFAMGDYNETSDRRLGELMVDDIVAMLTAEADGLVAEYDARTPKAALTYEDVETIWQDEIQPMLPDFASMQVTDDGPPADSRWRANWAIPARG
jgi:creatinine amidohydrolase